MEPSSRKVVTRAPARTVRIVNLPGILPASVEAESSLERDFIYRAALCPGVKAIAHQPFKLTLPDGNYTPDFLVTLASGALVVVEVKVAKKVAAYEPLFDQSAAKLRERGYEFLVITEKALRAQRVDQRVAKVVRYAKAAFSPLDLENARSVVNAKPQGLALGALMKRHGVIREVIFHLMCRHELTIGPRLAIDDAALVFAFNQSESCDAYHFARWVDAALWRANP